MLSLVAPAHVVIVVEEDRAANAIGDTTNMPYLNQLASTGLVYSNSHGLNTPSQDGEMNYLALYSGSTQGVTDDGYHGPFTGSNLAQLLNNAGKSFVGYAEAMPHNGDTTDQLAASPTNPAYDDLYTRSYNPMAQFSNAGTGKTNANVNQTFASFPTTAAGYAALPTVSFVIPDTLDDTHGSNDTSPYATDPSQYNFLRQTADTWLQNNLNGYLQWAKQNNSLLIITGDEGDRAHGFTSLATNDITTIVNGDPRLFVPGTDSTSITPYNILRTIEDMYGLIHLGSTATASDLDTNAAGQLTAPGSKTSTTTALSANANPSAFGQSLTFTATVTGAGKPGGTVTFMDGTTTLGSSTLNASGVATFTDSVLAVGAHSITANYAGDANDLASVSSVLSETVNKAATSLTLASSLPTSNPGQSVTFTATLSVVSPGAGSLGGTIQFQIDGSNYGTLVAVSGGSASVSDSGLSSGSHTITAIYGGDANFASSNANPLTQTVTGPTATTTTLLASANPAVFGQSITFTATVTGVGAPSGTITFMDGTITLGSSNLSASGVATFTGSSLAVGGHSITASYSGDAKDLASVSSVLSETVNKAATNLGLVSSSPTSSAGQSVMFTATLSVIAPGAGMPSGTIEFMIDGSSLASIFPISGGMASFSDASLSAGSHTITAIYSGDLNFDASTSSGLTHTVTVPPPASTASFVRLDTSTQGSWSGVYGSDGYDIFSEPASLPAYAQVSTAPGASEWTWATQSPDPRAMQNAPATTNRTASCLYSTTSLSFSVNLTDGQSHQVALYLLDWDQQSRAESVQVSDAASGTILDTRQASSFSQGQWLVWQLSGDVKITITLTRGLNPVASALMFDPVPSTKPTASASFVAMDATTQGNWSGVYGSDGYSVVGGTTSFPAYATMAADGASQYVWANPTSDIRAPLASAGSSARVAACDYSNSASFFIDLNLTDGQSHEVAIYALDWDQRGRAETVQITDAGTGTVLDTRTISNFSGGQWLVWNLSGHVHINVINAGAVNSVLSGVFFGSAPPTTPSATASFVRSDTSTGGTWTGSYGADGFDDFDGPSTLPSYAQVGLGAGISQYAWAASTTDPRALQIAPGATGRTAACYYAASSFTIDLNLTDNQSHRVALYLSDFDRAGRSESVQITDAGTGAVLDTESVTNFANGDYLVWSITGHVKITITNTGGWLNAVASGLFFG